MSQLTIFERAQVLRMAAAQAGRRGIAGVLGSPLLRWRYGAPVAEALAMVPQELRPADPSFAREIARGGFGLSHTIAETGDGSPFDIVPPNEAWARELHGFGWLRHLNAAASDGASELARALVDAWIGSPSSARGVAVAPDVTGRRIISWIANAELLLEGVDQAAFDRTARSLVDQLLGLSGRWGSAPEGYARLEALIGVVYGDVCILGHERHLAVSEASLAAELGRQVLPDGGHISRNTNVIVELLLDLLPLRTCYQHRTRPLPAGIEEAIARMVGMLGFMRLGDGSIARFNGVGATAMAEVASVLALGRDIAGDPAIAETPRSGYARLEAGGLVVIVDVGEAPPIGHAGQAHAGALSFELSDGPHAVLVNGGAPGPLGPRHAAAARATASHNALCLGERSSARLVVDERGGAQVLASGRVTHRLERDGAGRRLDASFAGYVGEHGLVHSRQLIVAADGDRLEGRDRLAGPGKAVRLAHDVPFAIRFHLAPRVACDVSPGGDIVLRLPDGAAWAFEAAGAAASVEPSIHYADPAGPSRSLQIVLRGACWGESDVSWGLRRAPR